MAAEFSRGDFEILRLEFQAALKDLLNDPRNLAIKDDGCSCLKNIEYILDYFPERSMNWWIKIIKNADKRARSTCGHRWELGRIFAMERAKADELWVAMF